MKIFKRMLNTSTLKIYRNNKNKAHIDTFQLDRSEMGPMVLDALIHIKNNKNKFFVRN